MGLLYEMARAQIEDFPDSPLEQAEMLKNILIARATGTSPSDDHYKALRQAFIEDAAVKPLLPGFVRTCRSLQEFWGYIKEQSGNYQGRRAHIYGAFRPLLDFLEGGGRTPADATISDALQSFDAAGIHVVWEKALARRQADPEGAITIARTLLETVCKRILDEAGKRYTDTEELPKLYHMAAEQMNLAPNQQSEQVFKSILGSCQNVVNMLASLRNKIGDAHGRGGTPVQVLPRHAELAVNLAGSACLFLVATWRKDA